MKLHPFTRQIPTNHNTNVHNPTLGRVSTEKHLLTDHWKWLNDSTTSVKQFQSNDYLYLNQEEINEI